MDSSKQSRLPTTGRPPSAKPASGIPGFIAFTPTTPPTAKSSLPSRLQTPSVARNGRTAGALAKKTPQRVTNEYAEDGGRNEDEVLPAAVAADPVRALTNNATNASINIDGGGQSQLKKSRLKTPLSFAPREKRKELSQRLDVSEYEGADEKRARQETPPTFVPAGKITANRPSLPPPTQGQRRQITGSGGGGVDPARRATLNPVRAAMDKSDNSAIPTRATSAAVAAAANQSSTPITTSTTSSAAMEKSSDSTSTSATTISGGGVSMAARRGRIPTPTTGRQSTPLLAGANNKKSSSILPTATKQAQPPPIANHQPPVRHSRPTTPKQPSSPFPATCVTTAAKTGKISGDECPAASNNAATATTAPTPLPKTTAAGGGSRREASAPAPTEKSTAAANTLSPLGVGNPGPKTSRPVTSAGVINSRPALAAVNSPSPSTGSTLSSFATAASSVTSSSTSTATTPSSTGPSSSSSTSSSVTSPAGQIAASRMSFMRPSSGRLPGLKKSGGGKTMAAPPQLPLGPGRFPNEQSLPASGGGERLAEESPLPDRKPLAAVKGISSSLAAHSSTVQADAALLRRETKPGIGPPHPSSTTIPGLLPSASASAVVGVVSPMLQREKPSGAQDDSSLSTNYANLPLARHTNGNVGRFTAPSPRPKTQSHQSQATREQYSSSPQLPPPMAPLGRTTPQSQFATDSVAAAAAHQQAPISERKATAGVSQRAKRAAWAVKDHPRYATYLQRVPRLDEGGDKGGGKHSAKSTGSSHHPHHDGGATQREFSSPSSSNSSTSISTDELDDDDDVLLSPESNDADELTTTASSAASDYYRYGYSSPTAMTTMTTMSDLKQRRKMSIPNEPHHGHGAGSEVNFRRSNNDGEFGASAPNAYHYAGYGSTGGRMLVNATPSHSLRSASSAHSSQHVINGQLPQHGVGGSLGLPKHYYHTVNLGQPGSAGHYYPASIMPAASSSSTGNRVKVPPATKTPGGQRSSHCQRILSPVPQPSLAGVGVVYHASADGSQLLAHQQQSGGRAYNSHSLDRNRHLRVFQQKPPHNGVPQLPASAIPSSPFRFSLASNGASNGGGESNNLSSFLVSPRHQLYGANASYSNGYGAARSSQAAYPRSYRSASRYATLQHQNQNHPAGGVYYPGSEAAMEMEIPHHRSSSLAPSTTGEYDDGICRVSARKPEAHAGLMSKSMVMLQRRDLQLFHHQHHHQQQQLRAKAVESETVVGVTRHSGDPDRRERLARKKNSPYLSGRRTVLSVAPSSELNASSGAFFQLERNGSLSARHPLVNSHNSNGYPASATNSHHTNAHPFLNLHKLSTSANNSLLHHTNGGAGVRGVGGRDGGSSVSQGCLLGGEMAVSDELLYHNFGALPMGPGGIGGGGLRSAVDVNGRHHIYGALSERGGGMAIASSSNGGRTSQLSISSGISALTAATGGGMSSTLMEEKYEYEIAKLHREMDAYRGTISNLTAKHADYGQLIALFNNKLQLMLQHVERMQKKSQLKKEEIGQLNAQIENLRLMSVKAGVNIPAFGDLLDCTGDGASRHRALHRAISVERQHLLNGNDHESTHEPGQERRGSRDRSGSRPSTTSRDESNNDAKGKKYGWIRSSFTRAFHKSQSGKKETAAGGKDPSEGQKSRCVTIGAPVTIPCNSSPREEALKGPGLAGGGLAPPEVVVGLKKQLEDKDLALTDVRLDALDKAREVDMLRETVHRLKSENKYLKQNFCLLERRIRDDSLASSHQSLSTCCRGGGGADNDTDSLLPTYDLVPSNISSHPGTPARRNTILSTNSSELPSINTDGAAGMPQGHHGAIRVSLCLEMSGTMEAAKPAPPPSSSSLSYGSLTSTANPTPLHLLTRARQGSSSSTISSTHSSGFSSASHPSSNSTRSSKPLLTLGFLPPPTDPIDKWSDVDEQLGTLLEEYLHRIDPDMTLGVDSFEAIVGYEIRQLPNGAGRDEGGSSEDGESLDECRWIRRRDGSTGVWKISQDSQLDQTKPSELLASPSTTTIELRLKGAAQQSVDTLVMESLLPRALLEPLLHQLLNGAHRLLIHGSSGVGKSRLARLLARYLSAKYAIPAAHVVDIRFPPEEADDAARVALAQQKLVETLMAGGDEKERRHVILLDNLPVKRVQAVVEALTEAKSGSSPSVDTSHFIIATLNRTSEASISPLHTLHAFHLFAMTNRMDPVRSYMTRYLRRRLAEAELNGQCECGERMRHVFEFLARVQQRVNVLIERAVLTNGSELTIGPRTFLQCPLEINASREWFVELWNSKIAPYMDRVMGGRDTFRQASAGITPIAAVEDPIGYVCEQWPWLDGVGAERLLRGLECGSGANQAQPPRTNAVGEQNTRAQHPARRSTPSHCSSSLSSGYCSSTTVNINHPSSH